MSTQTRINFLNLPIGRGHPFYLEGIVEACNRSGKINLVRSVEDLFKLAPPHSRAAWRGIQWLYHIGSSPGQFGRLYNSLRRRNDLNRDSLLLSYLGAGIARRLTAAGSPVVVSHPILVPILRGKCQLVYQHGELVAPRESLVTGADLVIVPTESVADRFLSVGYSRDQILVSGLCIESAKVRQAQDSYRLRLQRIADSEPLTGAFFSSGAEPSDHISKLLSAAQAAVAHGHRAIVFAAKGKRLAKLVLPLLSQADYPARIIDSASEISAELHGLTLVLHQNHREESILSSRLFPEFDFFVAPSHERSNWAIGLGLPMFILEPPKGSFAPLNRDLLLEEQVAISLSENHASSFGARLDSLRHRGQLLDMARAGWQGRDITGFETIASHLASRFGHASV